MSDVGQPLPTFDAALAAAPPARPSQDGGPAAAPPARPSQDGGPGDAPTLPSFDEALAGVPPALPSFDGALTAARPASATVEMRAIAGMARVSKAVGDSLGALFSGPYGLPEKTVARFSNQTPEDVTGPLGLVRTFNRVVLESTGAAADVALRAGAALVVAPVAAVGQVAREMGLSDTWSNRLERDLLGLAVAAGVVTGTPSPAALGRFRAAARDRVAAVGDELPPAQRAEGAARLDAALDAGAEMARREAGDPVQLPPPAEVVRPPRPDASGLTEPRLAQPLHKDVVAAAEELLTAGGVTRAEGRLLSDQVTELLQTRRLSTDRIGAILDKHNVAPDAFAEMWRVNIRKAAQDMQALSAVEARLKALSREAGAEADLAALQEASGIGADVRGLSWWRRVDNIRRGLLVTQLSTAMRNLETQVGRVGLDVLQQGLDDGLRRVFLAPGARDAHPTDAFGTVLNIFARPRRTKKDVDAILGAFPKEQDRLFGNWMSEFSTGAMNKAENAVRLLNTANRFQEYVIRRAVFQSRLAVEMQRRGQSLEDIVARGAPGEIPRAAVEAAVDSALEMTWAKGFSPFAKGPEGLAGSFIKIINEMPGATVVIPFPRFLMNAVKFQYEWSPLGYLRLLSPSQRASIAAGDMSAISRASIGTGLLLMAHQFRNSEYAGERWYEARLPDGRTIDLRPFNPFASYLFIADLVKRRNDGTLNRLTAGDIASGVLATQMRAGTGAYILDSLLNGIAGLEVGDKGKRLIADLAGNYISGFAVPFNMISDFLAGYDDRAAVLRSGREGPHLGAVNVGPLARNIPGIRNDLPALRSPLREGEISRESPVLRQFTGIAINAAKNPVEAEIDRLGITRKEFFPSTGDPTADRLLATEMGPIVSRALPGLVTSKEYKTLNPAVQAYVLLEALHSTRDMAKSIVAARQPALALRLKLAGMASRKRAAIDAMSGGKFSDALRLLQGGETAKDTTP